MSIQPLEPEKLKRKVDASWFNFTSTKEIDPLEIVIGQERAMEALAFGTNIKNNGYHVFALGDSDLRKKDITYSFLQKLAEDEQVPDEWMYVNNFAEPDKPIAINLPSGKGRQLCEDMAGLVRVLETEVPDIFEQKEYQQKIETLQKDVEEQKTNLLKEFETEAKTKNFTVIEAPQGFIVMPVINGEVISPDKYDQLNKRTLEKLEKYKEELQQKLNTILRQAKQVQQEFKTKLGSLDKEMLKEAIKPHIEPLKVRYAQYKKVIGFITNVEQDILDKTDLFKGMSKKEDSANPLARLFERKPSLDTYKVNLIVDNSQQKGAPVIVEENPNYHNLVGTIEFEVQFGALVTNFQNIKPGALHKANGGYLLVKAQDILTKPFAWEALKRALEQKEIQIEVLGKEYRTTVTKTLEPQPIPLDVKVVVLGSSWIYYLLYYLDDDFRRLFKVQADFSAFTDWNEDSALAYARYVAKLCTEEGLIHFAPGGVAAFIEYASRIVGSQTKLSTKFETLSNLIRESSFWAGKTHHNLVQDVDVKTAIDKKIYRSNKIDEIIKDMIKEGTLLIETKEYETGQINGLAVTQLGDYAFGKPSRITARVSAGREGVVNIERETELGGKIHNKGVLILTGYLREAFAHIPLALWASLAFEQSYSEVEGDSASSAELYVLLSSLAGLPLRQDIATTGSVNQQGQVQAIGGVNEKIEGFFEICKVKGLTGTQGVLIPESNVKNLVLKDEVIEAVKQGQFAIYPIKHITEGIELLTGMPAGEKTEDGRYPKDSVYGKAQARLEELAERSKVTFMGAPYGAP